MKASKASTLYKWIIWILYVSIIVFLASRHESWRDEWHVWFMDMTLSIGDIFRSMVDEGHFALWHLLVFPLAKLGLPYFSMYLLSSALSALAAWLLLFKSDFPVWVSAFLLGSGPLIYYFSVLSRCYCIIPPLIICLALLYRQLPRHNYLFCALLGLMAHTHAYMEGFVAIVFFVYVYEYVWVPLRAERTIKYSDLFPPLLTIFIVCLAGIQVIGSLSVASDLNGSMDSASVGGMFADCYRIAPFTELLAPTFSIFHRSFFILTDFISDLIIKSLFIYLFISCFIKTNRKMGLIIGVSLLYQLCFAVFIYGISLQRIYLPFLIVVFGVICSYKDDAQIERPLCVLILSLSILVSFNHNYRSAMLDISSKHPFSNACYVNSFLKNNCGGKTVLCPINHAITEYDGSYKTLKVPEVEEPDFADVITELLKKEEAYFFMDRKCSNLQDELVGLCSVKQIDGFKEDKTLYETWFLYEISKTD